MSCGPSLRVFFQRTRGVRAGRGTTIGRLEGIAWRFRTGSPWRDLPPEFGAYQSVWERHRRWSTDGTYTRMFAKVRDEADGEQRELLGLISVDSTSVRAHQHAAGARPTLATGGWME